VFVVLCSVASGLWDKVITRSEESSWECVCVLLFVIYKPKKETTQVQLALLRNKNHNNFIDSYHQGRGTFIPIINTQLKISELF
jgi:hypothetical protein